MSYVDVLKNMEHARLNGQRVAVKALRSGCVPVIRAAVNIYLAGYPPFPFKDRLSDEIADRIIAVVQRACDYALEIIDFFDELVECIGSPDTLRAAAEALLTDVDGPANDLLLEFKEAALPSRYTWNDPPTSLAYADARAAQPGELERLLPFIESLRGILREMADAIENFYIELGIAITGLVGAVAGLIIAAGATGTVIGIPVAVISVIAAIASLLAAIGGIIAMCVTSAQVQGNLLNDAKSGFTHTWANYGQFATVQ